MNDHNNLQGINIDSFFVKDQKTMARTIAKAKAKEIENDIIEDIVKTIIIAFGDDPDRQGLVDTPARFRRWIEEFRTAGKDITRLTTFPNEGYDEMIVESNLPFYSLCEHHLLPFIGFGTIAYIPKDHIFGLSKLPRILDYFSYRLQNQERITKQVADFIQERLDPVGVAVSLRARHMCMELRGVRKHNAWTTTNILTGAFKQEPSCRNEFMKLISTNGG
jgi:GTP cyclohydrolase IA